MNAIETDRREVRSHHVNEALYLQLVHAAEQFDLEAFTIADDEGHLIATSARSDNGHDVSDLVAAFSPMLADHRELTRRSELACSWLDDELQEMGVGWESDELAVREFHAGENRLFLTAVGGDEGEREVGIYRVIFGVRRILKEAA